MSRRGFPNLGYQAAQIAFNDRRGAASAAGADRVGREGRGLNLFGPALEAGLGSGPIRAVVEDRRQQGAQHVGARQGQRPLEQIHPPALLAGIQRRPFPAQQGPPLGGRHRPFGGRAALRRLLTPTETQHTAKQYYQRCNTQRA